MSTGNRNIIHIEDRDEDTMLVKRVLKKQYLDLSIISMSDSEIALEEILDGTLVKKRPRLILIDIKMPKISGFELLEQLNKNENFIGIPRIIWSSSSQPDDIKKAYKLGANSYLEKPKDYSKLKTTLLTTVDYWLNHNLTRP